MITALTFLLLLGSSQKVERRQIKTFEESEPTADFMLDKVTVYLPKNVVDKWAGTDAVTIKGEVKSSNAATSILVEKDFKCLIPREDEKESNLYPNPLADPAS